MEPSTEYSTFILPGCKYIIDDLLKNTRIRMGKVREFKIQSKKKNTLMKNYKLKGKIRLKV